MTKHNRKNDFLILLNIFLNYFSTENFTHPLNINYKKNTKYFCLKRLYLQWIEYFTERRQKFSHIHEMCIATVSNKKYMVYEKYIKEPMQMVEYKMNMVKENSFHIINTLDRSINHPSNRNSSIFHLQTSIKTIFFEKILIYRL